MKMTSNTVESTKPNLKEQYSKFKRIKKLIKKDK